MSPVPRTDPTDRPATPAAGPAPAAFRVRLPGLISGAGVGLGDVVKRATTSLGVRPCGGCERRAAALNRWMTFTR